MAQAYDLLARHDVFAREACDRCGAILGAVRYTRRGESGAWCSRECRGDGEWPRIRRGGRPKKYKTDIERCQAERQQSTARQRAFRASLCNGKPPCSLSETKGLQAQKVPLSTIPFGSGQ